MSDIYTVTNINSGISKDLSPYNFDLKYSETVPYIKPKIVPIDYSLALLGYHQNLIDGDSVLSGIDCSLLIDKASSPVDITNALYGGDYTIATPSVLSIADNEITPLTVGNTDITLFSGIGISGRNEAKKANLNVVVSNLIYPVRNDAGGGWGKYIYFSVMRNYVNNITVTANTNFTTTVYTDPDLYFRLSPNISGGATLQIEDAGTGRTCSEVLYFYTLKDKYSTSMSVGGSQTVTVAGLTAAQTIENINWKLINADNENNSSVASGTVSTENFVITALAAGTFRIKAYIDSEIYYISNVITIS